MQKKNNVSRASILALAFSAILGLSMTGCASKNIDASDELKAHVSDSISLPDSIKQEDVVITTIVADKLEFSKGDTFNLLGTTVSFNDTAVLLRGTDIHNASSDDLKCLELLKEMPNLQEVFITYDMNLHTADNEKGYDSLCKNYDVTRIASYINDLNEDINITVYLSRYTQEMFDAVCVSFINTTSLTLDNGTFEVEELRTVPYFETGKHTMTFTDALKTDCNKIDFKKISRLHKLESISVYSNTKIENFEELGKCKCLSQIVMNMYAVNTNHFMDNEKLYDLNCFADFDTKPYLSITDMDKIIKPNDYVNDDNYIESHNHYALERFGFYHVEAYYGLSDMTNIIY